MQASSRTVETGGERSHKTRSKFDPFRTTRAKGPTFDFPISLKYPFCEYRSPE
jgi:hypothetical protein